jgi:hypothetical protein
MGTSPPSTLKSGRSAITSVSFRGHLYRLCPARLEMEHNEHTLMQSDIPLVMDTWEEVHSYEVHGNSSMKL